MEHRAVAVKLKTKAKPKLALKPTGSVSIGSGLLPGAPRVAGPTSQAGPVTPSNPVNPLDPATLAVMAQRAKGYEHTLGDLAAQEATLKREYFDPTNPMSRQAMLTQQFRQTRDAQHVNQAASGQLYSGSSATEDAFTNQDEGFGNASLQNQYQSAIDAIGRQRQQASDDTIGANLETMRTASGNYSGDVANTPMGAGLPSTVKPQKTSAAEMKARVKARILAARKAAR